MCWCNAQGKKYFYNIESGVSLGTFTANKWDFGLVLHRDIYWAVPCTVLYLLEMKKNNQGQSNCHAEEDIVMPTGAKENERSNYTLINSVLHFKKICSKGTGEIAWW